MQRTTAAHTVAASLLLTLRVAPAHNVSAQARPAHAARPADRVTACGVERWRVKIGMDPDAHLVKSSASGRTSRDGARGAKSYPETSAQHHALWAGIVASMICKKPLEAERYINAAEASAALALAAPIAEPTQTGVSSAAAQG